MNAAETPCNVRSVDGSCGNQCAGDICGSGFNPRKHGKVCDLHTNVVSTDSLITYWDQLHAEHRAMLFSLPRHDFETELESCCSCALVPP